MPVFVVMTKLEYLPDGVPCEIHAMFGDKDQAEMYIITSGKQEEWGVGIGVS